MHALVGWLSVGDHGVGEAFKSLSTCLLELERYAGHLFAWEMLGLADIHICMHDITTAG